MLENNKIKIILDYLYKYGIMIVLMCAMSFVLYDGIRDADALPKGIKILLFLGSILVMGIAGLCALRYENQIHKVYLIVFVLVGLVYFFVYPIGTVPDEYAHYYRAYEISEGHLISDIKGSIVGRDLPSNLKAIMDEYDTSLIEMWQNADIKLSEEREFQIFWTASLYAPISYAPQSIGIFITRLFTKSVVLVFMGGRLFNFIAAAFVSYLAIKYIPFGKKIIFMIMLLPVNMQEAISLAPDTMVTALTMAFIAFILHLRYKQETVMSKKQLVLLYIMAIAISLYKIVYMPFCILPFLIPMDRFGGKKKYIAHAICMGLCVIVIGFGWLSFASRYLPSNDGGVNSGAQVAYILGDIPNYLKIIWNTIKQYWTAYFYTMLGSSLSWNTVQVPKSYLLLYAVVFAFCLFRKEKMPEKFGAVRGMLLTVIVAVFLLVLTSLYVQWSNHKSMLVEGVQGRYFIPLLLPLFLLFSFHIPQYICKVIKIKNFVIPAIAVNFIVLSLLLNQFISQEAIWEKDTKGWKYNVTDSGYVIDSWKEIGHVWFYFDKDGYALCNETREIDGVTYCFLESCCMLIGWGKINGEWYYCAPNGSAYTGWIQSSGEWYYCDNAKMLYDCVTPDGYRVDADGKRIEE